MKRKVTKIEITCDCCEESIPECESTGTIYFENTGFTFGGSSAVGIDIIAIPHRTDIPSNEHAICKLCAQKALLNASKTLPEWNHMLRAKMIIKDLLSWYDDGNRDMRDLDRIYEKASDLFGGN